MYCKNENFWLECAISASRPVDDRTIYVEKLGKMTAEDFLEIVNANPNRYSSGLYHLWGDEQEIVQKFSKNKINCKKYSYTIITKNFIEILKATKAAHDDFEIEWFNKRTGIKAGDDHIVGTEKLQNAQLKDLCDEFGFSPKEYPFDGLSQSVTQKHNAFIQKFIQHRLDFDQYQYFITNAAKGLNCAEWDKWLPI